MFLTNWPRLHITGIVNRCLTCVLLDTGATVSVLSENTWKKSGPVSKLKTVTGKLTIANGNKLTVLEETEVGFCIENMDCS